MTGLCVHAIIRADHPGTQHSSLEDGPAVTAVQEGSVTAAVSDAPPRLRAKRRNLAAHLAVVTELSRHGDVLPMRFGVVAPDDTTLREQLSRDARRYLDLLDEIAGQVEINVKVLTDENELVREAATHQPVQRLLHGRDRTETYDQMLELGQAVARQVEERQHADARTVLATLSPMATRVTTAAPVSDCALNVSFLVERDRTDDFIAALTGVQDELGPWARLHWTGPLPPFSFVTAEAG